MSLGLLPKPKLVVGHVLAELQQVAGRRMLRNLYSHESQNQNLAGSLLMIEVSLEVLFSP